MTQGHAARKGHHWVAMVTYELDDATARALASHGHGQVGFDKHSRVAVQVGCWDCELPYEVAKDLTCRPGTAVKSGRKR